MEKAYTRLSLEQIQKELKKSLNYSVVLYEAWEKVEHLTKKDGSEFKYITKSFKNANIDYDILGRPELKVYAFSQYNGHIDDYIRLTDNFNAYVKVQKYPENTYINRLHYLTPYEAMEVIEDRKAYLKKSIEDKEKALKNIDHLYMEYIEKLKNLYNEMLDKCGDNIVLKSSMKEALEGVKVY